MPAVPRASTAHPLLPREPHARERLPRVRGRGQGRPRARPGLLAQGRGRDGGPAPTPSASGSRARSCSSSLARPSTCRWPVRSAGRLDRRLRRALRGGSDAVRAARGRPRPRASDDATIRAITTPRRGGRGRGHRRPAGRRSTTSSTSGTTRSASSATSASRRAARTPRTRSRSPSRGAGFDARISTEFDAPLPDSACVYCGNCIGVCPTGALMFKSEYDMRAAGTWDESAQTVDRDDLPVLRRRLRGGPPRPGRPDREGDLAARLLGHRGPPLHQGPLRLRVRERAPGPQRLIAWGPRRAAIDLGVLSTRTQWGRSLGIAPFARYISPDMPPPTTGGVCPVLTRECVHR